MTMLPEQEAVAVQHERRVRPLVVPPGVQPEGRAWARRHARWLVLGDAVAIAVAVAAAHVVRFGGEAELVARSAGIAGLSYTVVGVLLGLFWLATLMVRGAYSPRVIGLGAEEFKRVAVATLTAAGVIAVVNYLAGIELARGYVAVAFPLGLVLLLLGRYGARRWLHRQRARGRMQHRVLVVGDRAHVLDLARTLRREPWAGYAVVGACPTSSGEQFREEDDLAVVGDVGDVPAAIRAAAADTVAVMPSPGFAAPDLRRLAWAIEGMGVELVVAPSLTDVAGPRIHVRPLSGLPLLHIDEPRFTGIRRVAKRGFDLVGSSGLLLLTAPLLLGSMVAIRREDGGPAVFRQTRVGIDGRHFTLLKLRTMVEGAHELRDVLAPTAGTADGPLFKLRQDPRVTRVGAHLRRWSIDELPQLVNVLRGEMSLVGPRPPLPEEVERYGDDVRRRLLVVPGLTGLWQVSGRSDLSWEDSVRLDLYYVENWSFSQDLAILWKTWRAVLERRGAY